MTETNYWLRRKRMSRRGFVGGAAAASVGAAAFGLVGCGDDDDEGSTATSTGTGSGTASATGTASGSATATSTAGAKQQGGVVRFTSSNNTYDTFDVDRSRFSPFGVLMGLTNQGIISWDSFSDARLRGDFMESWEQVDDTTFTFKLAAGTTWHDKPPVNGRAATAEDAAAFLLRNKAGKLADGTDDPNFYRKALFAGIESATATDNETLTVKLATPNPLFLGTLAQSYTKIQAPEAVAAFEATYASKGQDKIIGTGPFVLTDFRDEGSASLRRFDKFPGEAWLDGIDYLPLFTDAAAQQASFEQKDLDAFTPRVAAVGDELKSRFKDDLYEKSAFAANPMAGTYYAGAEPWSDHRLIGAFFLTIDRRALIQQMFQGRGVMSPSGVPTPQTAFTITERELIQLPGFREDRDADLADAKQMWEAAGGPSLGEVILDIPDIWEGAYSGVSSLLKNQFEGNLTGLTVTPKIETYATITTKIVTQKYGGGTPNIWYGWITDITDVEPTNLVYLTYNSKSPQWPQFGYKVDEVDSLTDRLLVEFDLDERVSMLKELVPIVTREYGMGVPYNMVNINSTLYWNYLNTGEAVSFITSHNWGRDYWINQDDPSFEGRKA